MEPVINPNYVLRERKNNEEIEISYYNTDTYVNVDKKRPCYENLDNPTSLKRYIFNRIFSILPHYRESTKHKIKKLAKKVS